MKNWKQMVWLTPLAAGLLAASACDSWFDAEQAEDAACKTDSDCKNGETCDIEKGDCVAAGEDDDASSEDDDNDTTAASEKKPCETSADCDADLVCRHIAGVGTCGVECRTDRDCQTSQLCIESFCKDGSKNCIPPSSKFFGSYYKGVCRQGQLECRKNERDEWVWVEVVAEVGPTEEICDKLNNDCDDETDEGCDCTDGQTQPCGSADGTCFPGNQACVEGKWGPCVGGIPETDEICDGEDNDCDTHLPADEEDEDSDGYMPCEGDRDDKDPAVHPNADEICDGLDNDCDGEVDEGMIAQDENGVISYRRADEGCLVPGICGRGRYECIPETDYMVRCSTAPGGTESPALEQDSCDTPEDDNCDGSFNENCDCTFSLDALKNDSRLCGDSNVPGTECRYGVQWCQPGGTWGPCDGNVDPQPEICDDHDNDCDGEEDEDFGLDEPCGTGACLGGVIECAKDSKKAQCSTEKGGSDNRSSEELCDDGLLDEDCDGETNEGYGVGIICTAKGVCGDGVLECVNGTKQVICSTAPGGSQDGSSDEVCDTFDNDCDGVIDENVKNACGVCGAVPVDGPTACDGEDNDCDGTPDEGCVCVPGEGKRPCNTERDGHGVCVAGYQYCEEDGTGAAQWSADCVKATLPTAEICDGLDNDCDDFLPPNEANADGDGFMVCEGDCDDSNAFTRPGAVEICDGLDNDCVGGVPANEADADGDGVRGCDTPRDCDDTNPLARPGMIELCEEDPAPGVDNDCNDLVNDNIGGSGYSVDQSCQGVGECPGGKWECDGLDGLKCSTNPGGSAYVLVQDGPTGPSCDGKDNDCDGAKDEGCGCVVGSAPIACGPFTTLNGECKLGQQTCNNGVLSACQDSVDPVPELCDGLDNDCVGGVPPNEADADNDGVRLCSTPTDCDDNDSDRTPGAVEVCDRKDNDCNNLVDDGIDCPVLFVWTPPSLVNSDFELHGCIGPSVNGQGRVNCLADWAVLCVAQNLNTMECYLSIPPGWWLDGNSERLLDGFYAVQAGVLQGTVIFIRGSTTVGPTSIYLDLPASQTGFSMRNPP